jgi:hypothetical protein
MLYCGWLRMISNQQGRNQPHSTGRFHLHADLPPWAAHRPTPFRLAPDDVRLVASRLSFTPGWYARRSAGEVQEIWMWDRNSRWIAYATRPV